MPKQVIPLRSTVELKKIKGVSNRCSKNAVQQVLSCIGRILSFWGKSGFSI